MRKLFSAAVSSPTTAALIMAAFGVASRLLGFLRDRILAARFGAGDTLDVYYAAFRLPDLMFELLILGALGAAFIPVFSGLLAKEERQRAWRLAERMLLAVVEALVLAASVAFVLAPVLVPYLVPGFGPEKTAQTVFFTRVMLLSPIFLGASAVFGALLVSLRKFFLYSLAPIFYNSGIIFGAIFFVDWWGSVGLAWGVVLGALLHLAVSSHSFFFGREKKRDFFVAVGWRGFFTDRDLRRVFRLMIPRAFGAAAWQLNLLAVTFFASLSAAGSLAAFTFANNIQTVPIGLVGIPFAVAIFPALSAAFARGETDRFVSLTVKYLRRAIFLTLPLSMLLITLRAQIVRVVLGSGVFDWADTIATFQILGILALSIFAQAGIPLLARCFYAMENTKTPLFIALVAVATNIGFSALMLEKWGIYAVAAGFSLGALVNFVLLFAFLEKAVSSPRLSSLHRKIFRSLFASAVASAAILLLARWRGIDLENLGGDYLTVLVLGWIGSFWLVSALLDLRGFFFKLPVATALAALAAQLGKIFVGTLTDLDTFLEVLAQLSLAAFLGLGTYLLVAYLLKVDEFFVLRGKILASIIRRGDPTEKNVLS